MSWLGLFNFLVLQWFCVRLAKVKAASGRTVRWTLLRWPLPLTGWWSPYIWIR